MTFSFITIALLATTAGICFSARLDRASRLDQRPRRRTQAQRLRSQRRDSATRIDAAQPRPAHHDAARPKSQSLRDRLTQAEALAAQKEAEIVKRDREIRLARSELQIVKDGSIGGVENPDLVDGARRRCRHRAPRHRSENRHRDEAPRSALRIAEKRSDPTRRPHRRARTETRRAARQTLDADSRTGIADLQAAAELAQATLAARDTTIRICRRACSRTSNSASCSKR